MARGRRQVRSAATSRPRPVGTAALCGYGGPTQPVHRRVPPARRYPAQEDEVRGGAARLPAHHAPSVAAHPQQHGRRCRCRRWRHLHHDPAVRLDDGPVRLHDAQ